MGPQGVGMGQEYFSRHVELAGREWDKTTIWGEGKDPILQTRPTPPHPTPPHCNPYQ